jgi:hypothetical protein
MLQWMKKYFDQRSTGGEYDGPGRRAELGVREPGDTSKGKARAVVVNAPPKTPRVASARAADAPPASAAKLRPKPVPPPPAHTPAKPSGGAQAAQRLQELVTSLKKENETLLEERNFYYEKLQRVEAMCQVRETDDFCAQVLAVLYEANEGRGFLSPDELDI